MIEDVLRELGVFILTSAQMKDVRLQGTWAVSTDDVVRVVSFVPERG